jgi:hypothetical protein
MKKDKRDREREREIKQWLFVLLLLRRYFVELLVDILIRTSNRGTEWVLP